MLTQLQAKWAAEGKQAIDIGIGINTGDMQWVISERRARRWITP
jgi:hypothetical protein